MLLALVLAAGSAASADIRPMLREQGFEGPLNGREEIAYAGHIVQGPNDYQIYVYRGAARAAAVDHGVNGVIVILNHSIFLGQYAIPMPAECRVRGQRVICNTESPGVIEFTRRGPPREIWFDGEILSFTFGDRIQR